MLFLQTITLGLLSAAGLASAMPSTNLFTRQDQEQDPAPASAQCGYATVQGYKYIGCYDDNRFDRAIEGGYFASGNDNSPTWCASNCASQGYSYFGLEYGSECFCSNQLNTNQDRGNLRPDFECNFPCGGDRTLPCGATDRLNVYKLS